MRVEEAPYGVGRRVCVLAQRPSDRLANEELAFVGAPQAVVE
jgi:hypothetical protein